MLNKFSAFCFFLGLVLLQIPFMGEPQAMLFPLSLMGLVFSLIELKGGKLMIK